jgi:hypothetical protein
VITHIVMMKLTDPADSVEAVERLRNMEGKIPDLLSVEVLADGLRRDGAYDVVLRSTHRDEAGLVGYLEHPEHQALLGWLRPRLAARAVIDAVS